MGQEESHGEEIDLAQIQELCIVFMKECPSGALHLHEFKRIFGVPSTSAEESLFIETIFHSFDTNQVKEAKQNNCFVQWFSSLLMRPPSSFVKFRFWSQDNALDFLEYVAALHLILRGNLEDRLKWSFKIYDKDGNGKLDRQEVKRLIRVSQIASLWFVFCHWMQKYVAIPCCVVMKSFIMWILASVIIELPSTAYGCQVAYWSVRLIGWEVGLYIYIYLAGLYSKPLNPKSN